MSDDVPNELWIVRHGATEWARNGRHTSVTDLPLLPEGEDEARALGPRLADVEFTAVLSSPRERARRTAELAGFTDIDVVEDVREWEYGPYEGLTRAQIHERDPEWTIWTHGTPTESPEQIGERLDRVVARVRETGGRTIVFAHGHSSRALAARWLGRPVAFGGCFSLQTATVSVLGWEHVRPAIRRWNS